MSSYFLSPPLDTSAEGWSEEEIFISQTCGGSGLWCPGASNLAAFLPCFFLACPGGTSFLWGGLLTCRGVTHEVVPRLSNKPNRAINNFAFIKISV